MNKCLCPCPDYIKVPIEHGMTETYLLKGFGTVLHGKKATAKCDKCKRGICCDCGKWTRDYFFLCNSCAREEI